MAGLSMRVSRVEAQAPSGEDSIAVAISVNSWRRIVIAVSLICLDDERILWRERTGRQRIPIDAMKRTTGGEKTLVFVMERTKSVIAKRWFGDRETECVKCFGKIGQSNAIRAWREAAGIELQRDDSKRIRHSLKVSLQCEP